MQILKNLEENIKLKSSIKIENLVITPIVFNDFYHEHKIVSLDDLFDRQLAEAKEISDQGIVSRVNIVNKVNNFYLFQMEKLLLVPNKTGYLKDQLF